MSDLGAIALAELEHRLEQGNAAIRARRATRQQVDARLRPWAAIAAWCGADVRPFLSPAPGVHSDAKPVWIDFCPRTERADHALRRLAEEARRAARVALERFEAGTGDQARAQGLLALARRLSQDTGLGPIGLSRPTQAKAAA